MQNLKREICEELLKELETTTLDKIRVSTICKNLGVTRQSFYYYFKDPYECFEVLIEEATKSPLSEYTSIDTWTYSLSFIMRWFKDHEVIIVNSMKAVGYNYMLNLLRRLICPYLYKIISTESKNYEVTEYQVRFMTDFISISVISVFMEWLTKFLKEPIDFVFEGSEAILRGDIKKGLANLEALNKTRSKMDM